MSNNSIVEHRGSYYFVALREEYLMICMQSSYKKPVKEGYKCKATPHCKALILDILEHWTNMKRGRGEDLAVFMTYQQWSDSMYGMFGRTAIIDSLDELIGEGLVSREPYKMPGNKDTYQYRLNYQELNKRIRRLPERSPYDTRPQVNASTSKPDPSTSKRVTRPQVDAHPSTSKRNIDTSIDTKNIDPTERTNGAHQPNVSTSDESSIHSSTHQSSSEISFSAEEETVYQLAGQKHISALKRNQDHKDHCAKLASKGVTTPEKIESLMQHCWRKSHLKGKDLYLKNLVTELDGWLQVQEMPQVPTSPSRNPQPVYVIDQEANERRKAALRAIAIS